jgi:hypothetical protein
MSLFKGHQIICAKKIYVAERYQKFLIWFVFNGIKYFALNKFSVMEWQRGKLFEHREFFPSNVMELNL